MRNMAAEALLRDTNAVVALSHDVDAERVGEDVPDPLEYCAGVRARTFGSDFEIRVLSKELRVRVHVYASTGVRQRFPDPEEDENRRWPLVRLSKEEQNLACLLHT